MSSWDFGKQDVVRWICEHFPAGSTCLDVGPSDGKWSYLLGNHMVMDAVEIYEPYINVFELYKKYRRVYCGDIANFTYDYYDVVLFGDVIEHMTVANAQKVIEYASSRCKSMVVAVPFEFKQGPMRGNKWEEHIQDDLTPELFDIRYPGFTLLCRPVRDYAYYVKDGGAQK